MIDTHAHLDFPEFDQDREEVIARFFSRDGKAIINVGVDLEHSRKSIELAQKHEGVFAAVGLHPDYFSKRPVSPQGSTFLPPTLRRGSSRSNLFDEMRELARHEKVVAIGEIGLDYYQRSEDDDQRSINFEEIKENQKKGFLVQIEIARELNLPVIVHCREGWDDLYEIISKVRPYSRFDLSLPRAELSEFLKVEPLEIPQGRTLTEFVLHCYSGGREDTEKFLKLPNVCFSFSGNITYPKPASRAEQLAGAVRMIPLDKIMLDSDAPFLAPQEMRGKRNEPIFVKYIAKSIAEIKQIDISEVEKVTDENAVKFFGLG